MTLNDIRNKSGLLILVIGVAMLGFVLMDGMNSASSLFQKSQNLLLKVGKTEIQFTAFEKELEESINVKFASNLGTSNISQQQRNSERDLLWDQKVKEILFQEKFNQSGVTVSQAEVWDLISGEITGKQEQLFGYFFREQTTSGEWNTYSPEMIQSWIEMGTDNPQWFRYIFFKNNTTRDRGFNKYYNAIKKGMYVTNQDAKSYYMDQNQSVNGEYIYIPNSQFKVADIQEKDIQHYYKNNHSEFKNKPSREISYFVFNLEPSEADKSNVINELSDLIADKMVFNKRTNLKELDLGFQNTESIEDFVNQYGDNKYELVKLSKLEHNEKIEDDIIRPYIKRDICRIGRIVGETDDSLEIVYLDRKIYASDETLNELYSNVYDILNKNEQIQSIDLLAEEANSKPRTVVLGKMDESVAGLGLRREIVRWAFNSETKINRPNFFDLEDKYVIAVLTSISENETKNINVVYDEIKKTLMNKAASEKIVQEIKKINPLDLKELANNFSVDVKLIKSLRMNSDVFGDEGYHPDVVGAFFGSVEGGVSSPIITDKGVFLVKRDKIGSASNPTSWGSYKKIITNNRESDVDLLLVDILKQEHDILDNRFNFY